ncbi:MAG: Na(+)/H(+) antiporter subunit D [Alphaproteobacteria bacterium]|nr:Na(+)/H(+) antiporter subunit D [Alphaproteobacteria bacterium]
MICGLPPGLFLLLGAALVPVAGRFRPLVLLLAPAVALAQVLTLPANASLQISYLGETLELVRVDTLSRLFGIMFALVALLGGLFALKQESKLDLSACFLYAGAALGVVFAGDLLTLFLFWEVMAVAAGLIVWAGRMIDSYGAAFRYLLVHLLGGVLLMAGIALRASSGAGLEFGVIGLEGGLASWLILAGFLVNAGAYPISAWVGDAYPESSYSGMLFLASFTTKSAVYVLLRGFPGTELLIPIGVVMALYGIIYALLENDMRRILAYSSVNQVGFMVTGIGIGTHMSLNGAASHAFAHILFKGLLVAAAGSVLLRTGRRKCSELGGLFQSMPVTMFCAVVGAFAISAFPLTSGFVSKSMINDAAAHEGMRLVWFLLTAASAGVFLHAGIKFPWFVFFQKDSGLRPKDPPWNMQAVMIVMAALCIGIGVWPGPFYALLPFEVSFEPYTSEHVIKMLQLLLFSGLSFFVLLPLMKRTDTLSLDADWLWRVLGPMVGRGLARALAAVSSALGRAVAAAGSSGRRALAGLAGQGGMSATVETGVAILVLTAALTVALALSLDVRELLAS